MLQILPYFWSIINEDWYSGFIQILKKNTEDSIILVLCVKIQRRAIFVFSFILFPKAFSYKALFRHNFIKSTVATLAYRTKEISLIIFQKKVIKIKNDNARHKQTEIDLLFSQRHLI